MNFYRRRHIFWILFSGMLLLISSCDNESVSVDQEESFLKYYPLGDDPNTGTTVIQRSDGYAILCNFTEAAQKDILVIFTDRFGRRTGESAPIGSTELDDYGYNMINLDGGYLICGISYDATQKLGYLVNITSDGTIVWEQQYRDFGELEFRDAILAEDGNLVMTGSVFDDQEDEDDEVMIFKTTALGDFQWIQPFHWPGDDVGESIIEFDDLYHVLVTATDVSSISETQIRVLTTTNEGRAPLNHHLPDEYLSGRDIIYNQAGQIFILANKQDPGSRVSGIYLAELELRTTPGGKVMETVKSSIISDEESLYAASFIPVSEGLAIGGSTWQEKSPTDKDILFMLVDNDLQEIDRKIYGAKSEQASQNIIYTDDEGFALTGSVDLASRKTTMLLKLDRDGELK